MWLYEFKYVKFIRDLCRKCRDKWNEEYERFIVVLYYGAMVIRTELMKYSNRNEKNNLIRINYIVFA